MGNTLSFMYSGDINELVGLLAGRKIVNLTIEEPSLEEIFMHLLQIKHDNANEQEPVFKRDEKKLRSVSCYG